MSFPSSFIPSGGSAGSLPPSFPVPTTLPPTTVPSTSPFSCSYCGYPNSPPEPQQSTGAVFSAASPLLLNSTATASTLAPDEKPPVKKGVAELVPKTGAPIQVVGLNVRNGTLRTIGRTPMVFFNRVSAGCLGQVAAKLETANPSGFTYDRVALALVRAGENAGTLRPNHNFLIFGGSGPFAASLALVGACKGYRVLVVISESEGIELRCQIRGYGADLILTSGPHGAPGALAKAKAIAEKVGSEGGVLVNPYEDPLAALAHRRSTAEEIWKDTHGNPDVVVMSCETGATLSGVGQFLRGKKSPCKVIAVEPAECAALTAGGDAAPSPSTVAPCSASSIPGLGFGGGVVSPGVDQGVLREIFRVHREQARATALSLARKEGLWVSPAAAAVVFAAVEIAKRPEMDGRLVVAVLSGPGERYLSSSFMESLRGECEALPKAFEAPPAPPSAAAQPQKKAPTSARPGAPRGYAHSPTSTKTRLPPQAAGSAQRSKSSGR